MGHKNYIAHFDLKIENLMFTKSMKTLKVIDFGRAVQLENADDICFDPVGTAAMTPPEFLLKRGKCVSDIWNVGIIAYMMLTGRPSPFLTQGDDLATRKAINDYYMNGGYKQGGYKFLRNVKNKICRRFIKACLNPDVSQRKSADDLLKYTWIAPCRKQLLFNRIKKLSAELGEKMYCNEDDCLENLKRSLADVKSKLKRRKRVKQKQIERTLSGFWHYKVAEELKKKLIKKVSEGLSVAGLDNFHRNVQRLRRNEMLIIKNKVYRKIQKLCGFTDKAVLERMTATLMNKGEVGDFLSKKCQTNQQMMQYISRRRLNAINPIAHRLAALDVRPQRTARSEERLLRTMRRRRR